MIYTQQNILKESIISNIIIGEGKYRIAYRFEDKVVKVLKSNFKEKFGLFKIDFNQFEYDNYNEFSQKTPEELKVHFSDILWVGLHNEISVSVSNLIKNDDGSIAKSIFENGKIDDVYFWNRLKKIEIFLIKSEIPLMDIRGENIVVKHTNGSLCPVIIDYKRFGSRSYPFQPLLYFNFGRKKKIKRRFKRLIEEYKG